MEKTLPPWNRNRSKDGKINWDGVPGFATWVPDKDPPNVGTRVRIMAWGGDICGDVEGYEVSHDYLMIWVKPDIRPEWHIRDNPNRHICLFAGIELEWPVV